MQLRAEAKREHFRIYATCLSQDVPKGLSLLHLLQMLPPKTVIVIRYFVVVCSSQFVNDDDDDKERYLLTKNTDAAVSKEFLGGFWITVVA